MKAIKYALLGLVGVVGLLVSTFGPFKIPFAETLAKTYYRYAMAGLMVVVVLLGGLVALAVNVLDPNQFKAQIVRWVQERTQRDLVLDGELKLSWFPKLGLETGKATLSQRRSAREFAAVDSARITIAWWPLLRRQVLIDRAEIDGLRAQLIRFKDGSSNVDDLVRDIATVSPASIDVDGLRLSRSTLQWNDEIEWQRGSLNDLQIEVGRLAEGRASPVSASARVDAPHAGVDARLQLNGRLLFDASAGRIELAGIDSRLEGKAFGVDNLALNLKADVTGLPGQRSLSAENIVITSSSKSGLSVFNGRLAAPELKFSEHRFSATLLGVDASIAHPDRTTTLAMQVPRFEWSERALHDTTAHAQLSLRSAGTHLRAQLSSPLLLHLEGGPRFELAALELSASANHPALATEVSAQGSGKLELKLGQQTAHAVLSGKIAGTEVRGDIALADFNHPRWTVDVDAARLDLDALLSRTWLAHWNDDATPFDAAALRDASVQGRMRVATLKLGGLLASAASARFDIDRSVLSIEPIAAQAYGATLDAAIRVDAAAAPRISARGTLTELDVRSLLADVTRAPWLEGRGAFAWELATDGASVGTLRNGLSGPLTFTLRGGALSGLDLRSALLDGRADLGRRAPGQQRDFNPSAATPFSEMKARLELRDGRAIGQSLELSAVAIRATGEGELVFDSGVLDLRLQAAVGRGAPELAALAGVNVPMQVQGHWRQPRFAFDFGAATGAGVPRSPEPAADSPIAMLNALAVASPNESTPAAKTGK